MFQMILVRCNHFYVEVDAASKPPHKYQWLGVTSQLEASQSLDVMVGQSDQASA